MGYDVPIKHAEMKYINALASEKRLYIPNSARVSKT